MVVDLQCNPKNLSCTPACGAYRYGSIIGNDVSSTNGTTHRLKRKTIFIPVNGKDPMGMRCVPLFLIKKSIDSSLCLMDLSVNRFPTSLLSHFGETDTMGIVKKKRLGIFLYIFRKHSYAFSKEKLSKHLPLKINIFFEYNNSSSIFCFNN